MGVVVIMPPAIGGGHSAMPQSVCPSVCLSVPPGPAKQRLGQATESCRLWIHLHTDAGPPRLAGGILSRRTRTCLMGERYRCGAGNTTEENTGIFIIDRIF